MEGSAWRALLAAIVLVQLTAGYGDRRPRYEIPEVGRLHFYDSAYPYNWPLSEKETNIVHIENAGPDRVFAYAVHDPSNKTAVINIVTTHAKYFENSSFRRDERCEFDFDVPDNSTVVIDSLRLWFKNGSYHASFSWHIKGEKSEHVDSVNSITCHHAEQLRELKKPRIMKPKAEEAIAPAAQAADLAKLEIPEGYHFVDEPASSESTVHIKHVNLTSGSVRLAAAVPMPEASSGLRRHSLALDRYGVCWTGDHTVTCAQGPRKAEYRDYELKTWATIRLIGQADFLGVLNYAEDKMLVLVGGCAKDSKRCNYFELYDVRPDGRVFRHTDNYLDMEVCRDQRDIRIGAYHDTKRNLTCFDGVCTAETSLTYRRKCAQIIN